MARWFAVTIPSMPTERVSSIDQRSIDSISDVERQLRQGGIRTLAADLLDREELKRLPDVENVIYMAGMKFGSSGNEPLTWAMNSYLPGMVCERFAHSRIAAFSTGNVYGLVPAGGGGSVETDLPNPVGEYAMSCLGRERIFQHFCEAMKIPVALLRLNYAVEMRYGVLLDIAKKVAAGGGGGGLVGDVDVGWGGGGDGGGGLLRVEGGGGGGKFQFAGGGGVGGGVRG